MRLSPGSSNICNYMVSCLFCLDRGDNSANCNLFAPFFLCIYSSFHFIIAIMSTTLELQPTTSRWRALTHAHARTIVPSSKNRSPFETLTETNIRGILVILVLSGCTDPRAVHHEPLRERFGPAIARISEYPKWQTPAWRETCPSGISTFVSRRSRDPQRK